MALGRCCNIAKPHINFFLNPQILRFHRENTSMSHQTMISVIRRLKQSASWLCCRQVDQSNRRVGMSASCPWTEQSTWTVRTFRFSSGLDLKSIYSGVYARHDTAALCWMPLMLGTHYPCSQAVFTGREHGLWKLPVNTGFILDTRDHGPSRSADAIVNDVIIISTYRMTPGREHGAVFTVRVPAFTHCR